MELETSTIMLGFFLILLTLSIWKIWAFLPNKQLEDDDRTQESERKLLDIMVRVIKENSPEIKKEELFTKMTEDKEFDKKLFWRFNINRLNHLLIDFYRENSSTSSIKDIYTLN